jgi:SAM-dependent methyltransferase/uncharacterized protein YbaR (Trm112 family)
MKESALRLLVCPVTGSPLTLDARHREGDEILEGFLVAQGGERYPVIGGVPRMLPPALAAHLREDYPEFFARYGGDGGSGEASDEARVQRHTQSAFGYEWTWADDYDADNFADWLPEGFDAAGLFSGGVGLEVGCGAGRHAERTARVAREHFAVDLSRAVDSAFARNRGRDNVHVVQADAFHLPFRPGSFDYVYCLGVLQHLHDPPAGFRALAPFPRPGGVLLVNVYQASRPVMQGALELMRKVTTRLPNPVLRQVSNLAGVADYGLFIGPWKVLKRTPLGRVLAPVVPGRIDEYARHDFRTCVVDWFDRLSCPVKLHYRREQLAGWYQAQGYTDIVVTPYWKAFWNGYGRLPAAA